MANLRKRTPEKDARLIGWLKRGDTFGDACRKAGYRSRTVYEWRREDPAYDDEIHAACEAGEDYLLGKLVERGFFGLDKPVYQGGQMVGTVREYDTTAAIFSLKARNPKRFNDKLQVEHGGTGGGPIQITKKVFHVVAPGAEQPGQVVDAEFTEVQLGTQPALPSPDEQGQPAAPVTVRKREF